MSVMPFIEYQHDGVKKTYMEDEVLSRSGYEHVRDKW